MKNLLIPTTLQSDTIQALKVALKHSEGQNSNIVLMLLHETPDTSSAAYWLRSMQNAMTPTQEEILEKCREMVSFHEKCNLNIHQQYSISGPLLRNFIESREINLVILPESFRNSQREINRYCVQLLANCKNPILQLATNSEEHTFSKALYLENSNSSVQAKDVQHLLGGQFSFSIVSEARLLENQNTEELTPQLFDTIRKNEINLLIETRRPEKIRLSKKIRKTTSENFGISVLSLCEPVY